MSTGTTNGFAGAMGAATTLGALQSGVVTVPNSIIAGANAAVALSGGGIQMDEALSIASGAANAGILAATGAASPSLPTTYAANEYAKTAQYKVEYPEDIKVYGVSFNTAIDSIGASLQGEYSYKKDAPLQIDDVELLIAALSPLGGLSPAFLDNQITNGLPAALFNVHSWVHREGYLSGTDDDDQTVRTNLWRGPICNGRRSRFGRMFTACLVKVDLRLESAGTYVTGNPNQAAAGGAHDGKLEEPYDAFADATSWGYRMVGKLDFNDAIGAVTLSPRIAWAHDVSGNTPGPGGSFIEGRKAITFGLGASYQATWSADLSYTDFFGAGRYNLINDRDFVALNIKYSF